jgi:glutamate-5-semialdehyde dehydrogenase
MTTASLKQMGHWAKEAAFSLAKAPASQKNWALESLADLLNKEEHHILAANERDKQQARLADLSEAMIDRLSLQGRLSGLADDVRKVVQLPDPVGEDFDKTILANGLRVCKRRTPIGVLGVIYESRPNVTIDVAALTIKTGNCAILRGGSETLQTNQALLTLIQNALKLAALPTHAIQLIATTDREQVRQLLRLHESVDLIIPRGGAQLHQYCRENSMIPVITGGIGICHLFVDESADLQRAIEVIFNAKTQRPTVCNALDSLLIHETIAEKFIPQVISRLQAGQVKFRVDPRSWQLLQQTASSLEGISQAQSEDWDTEWLSLVLGIRIVKNIEEAIQHIRLHSTGHSDGILTEHQGHAAQFLQEIDSAAVYVNASTRFTDGGQLGLGAEVAISTQKLHARGPMGLKELTTYKWIIQGDYHIRS